MSDLFHRIAVAGRSATRSRGARARYLLETLESRVLLSSDILVNHGNAASTGLVANETVLTPADVLSSQAASSITTNFGRLFDTTLDGQVYAQVLAKANVNITRGSSQGIHNVLYAATQHDSLYALDANTGAILWQDNFTQIANPQVATIGSPAPTAGVTTMPQSVLNSSNVSPELGILSTPVIDPGSNIIYLLTNTQEFRNGSVPASGGADRHFVQRLWGLNVSNGSVAIAPTNPGVEPTSGGAVVGDTIKNDATSGFTNYEYVVGPFVKGTGNNTDSISGGVITTNNADGWTANPSDGTSHFAGTTPAALGDIAFNALIQMNRLALTLINGEVYLGFASHGDNGPYYGWLLGYSASTLANNVAFVTVPNFESFNTVSGDRPAYVAQAGFWNSGAAITTDGTYLYISTGNGAFNPDTLNFSSTYTSTDNGNIVQMPLDDDYGDAVLKLQFDLNATQANINYNTGVLHNPNGSYNPDGGYNGGGYGLEIVDYFTPSNVFELNKNDEDMSSGGVTLIPSAGAGSATAPNGDPMLVTAGKEGRIYLIDADNLGGFNTAYDTGGVANTSDADPAPFDRVLGEYYYFETESGNSATKANTAVDSFCAPSYFNGDFYIGINSAAELGFNVTSTTPNFFFTPGPASNRTGVEPVPNFASPTAFGNRGTTATITSNGLTNAIIWNINGTGSSSDALTAYNTSGTLLFSTAWKISGQSTNTTDTLQNGVSGATSVKFSLPTSFNGIVYAGTGGASGSTPHGTVVGYGLLSSQLTSSTFAAPTGLLSSAPSTSDNHLTWTRHSTLETEMEIDRSTDGVNWSALQYVPSGTTSYDDAVTPGSNFYYRVRAISGSLVTTYSYALIVNSGTFTFSNDPATLTPSLAITDNATLSFTAPAGGSGINTRTASSLTLGNGALVTLHSATSPSDRLLLVLGALTFPGSAANWGAALDLGANDMIIQNAGATGLAHTFQQLTSGFAPGLGYWNGLNGIFSTAAAGDSTLLTTLGLMQNVGGLAFDGHSSGTNDILVKYTAYGDADLNGTLDGADYHQIDRGFGQGTTGWSNGDFNYDGIVNGNDYALIDNAFNQRSASPSAQIPAQSPAMVAYAPALGNLFRDGSAPSVSEILDLAAGG